MNTVTRVLIDLVLQAGDSISEIVSELPAYCAETFRETSPNHWSGEFIISCPVAPNLADGDLEDDFAPHFPHLIRLKSLYDASFRLKIVVGSPAPEVFQLSQHIVALFASLGADIGISTMNAEQDATANP